MLALYAGSFDPPTNAHLDLIERAVALFPHIIVATGLHPTRVPLFDGAERLELLQELCSPFDNVEVDSFDGLLVNYARKRGVQVIVRGLRNQSDFDFEMQLAHANADLAPDLDTVFLPSRTRHGFVSASLVRELASHRANVSRYVPDCVCEALLRKYPRKP